MLKKLVINLPLVGNKSFSNVRLFDSENRDITDQLEYCGNPSCLGEPWCSAFGIWNQLSRIRTGKRHSLHFELLMKFIARRSRGGNYI